ncbi:hypothetical protein [Microcoleus sp.]|uniref:hypothetical protein n=1 Tax=Microcoleus sp. TaxID=44472 RepID=UPI0035240568
MKIVKVGEQGGDRPSTQKSDRPFPLKNRSPFAKEKRSRPTISLGAKHSPRLA